MIFIAARTRHILHVSQHSLRQFCRAVCGLEHHSCHHFPIQERLSDEPNMETTAPLRCSQFSVCMGSVSAMPASDKAMTRAKHCWSIQSAFTEARTPDLGIKSLTLQPTEPRKQAMDHYRTKKLQRCDHLSAVGHTNNNESSTTTACNQRLRRPIPYQLGHGAGLARLPAAVILDMKFVQSDVK